MGLYSRGLYFPQRDCACPTYKTQEYKHIQKQGWSILIFCISSNIAYSKVDGQSDTYMKSSWQNLTHNWLWMIPILLVVSGLATRQINRFPISVDELISINNAGYISDDTSIPAILHNLETYSAQHVPAYFLLLGFASNVLGWVPPALRMIGVWCGLLALAWVYRIARDHHSGAAGLYAVVFMAGLTLYGYYYAHIRMYTLLTMSCAMFLWTYLRLIRLKRDVQLREWVMLSLSALLFLSSHIFSITFMIIVGLYHLLFIAKNRRWVQVSGAIILGGLPLVAWLPVLIRGFQHTSTFSVVTSNALTPPEILYHMLIVYSNSVIPLIIIALGILIFLSLRRYKPLRLWLGLSIGTGALIIMIGGITPIIPPDRMRYTFALLTPLAVAIGIGIAQFRYHLLLAGMVLGMWMGSDVWMQRTFSLADYLGGRMNIYDMPRIDKDAPLIAALTDSDTLILTFSNHRDLTLPLLRHQNTIQDFYYGNSNREHYSIFLDQEILKGDDAIEADLVAALTGWSKLALVTDENQLPPRRIRNLYDAVLAKDFKVCDTVSLSSILILTEYRRIEADCSDA